MDTLLFAAWIGIASLGITPEQSYDYDGSRSSCEIMVSCRSGEFFTDFSFDVADVGPIAGVTLRDSGITAWTSGALTWNGVTLSYDTGTGYVWTPAMAGHFLFLRSVAGRLFVAIEDMPAVWTDGAGQLLPSDFDYNDRLYEIQPVPEPASLGLLGLGLLGAARGIRRRRRDQHDAALPAARP